jgi:NADH dehydrogenase (ubiquinone) Fe-S protein 6
MLCCNYVIIYRSIPPTSPTMLSRRLVHRSLKTLSARSFSTPSQTAVPTKADKEAAKVPTPQSPNFATTWTTSQHPRPVAGENPRFEQTAMDLQPNPLSAMGLIANEPVRLVHARKAICDGGPSTSPPLLVFLLPTRPVTSGSGAGSMWCTRVCVCVFLIHCRATC